MIFKKLHQKNNKLYKQLSDQLNNQKIDTNIHTGSSILNVPEDIPTRNTVKGDNFCRKVAVPS